MYTLRIVEEISDGDKLLSRIVSNHYLGDAYFILRKWETSEFDEEMKKRFPETNIKEIKGLICAENYFFIEEDSENKVFSYFIMTDSGKTFEKL